MHFIFLYTSMHLPIPLKKALMTASLSLLVVGCSGQMIDQLGLLQKIHMERAYKEANSLLLKDNALAAAGHLWQTATELPPPHRQTMQVHAVNVLLDASRPLNAYRYLLQISEQKIEGELLLKKRVAEARFYQQTDQPERILTALPEQLVKQGGIQTRINAMELLSDALLLSDEFVRGIEMRLRLHKLLSEEQRPMNIATLWRALLYLNPWRVEEELLNNPDSNTRPWLELAALATPLEMNREELERKYTAWEIKNRRWPLPNAVVEALHARWQYLDYHPKKVALLLPLTGFYAKAGKTVRDGFFASYERTSTPEFTVTVHNTDQSTNIATIYAKAVESEAVDLVIGPLLKPEVDALLAVGNINTPTISLNYATTGTHSIPRQLFQFGLLPEHEASQTARKVWNDGHEFVAVLAPEDEWGERLYRAFETEYNALGGNIRALSRYDPGFVDYTAVIELLFQLDQSRERHRLVSVALGEKPRFKPRIRDDISAAVMFADHRRAIMIFPQMKFHHADKLPTYATSHVYNPQTLKIGRDLDGLIYCDIPAIIQRSKFTDAPADEYSRLFALGADAERLVKRFRHMEVARFPLNGQTGEISIEANHRLFRKLPWARFSRGKPVPIDAL